jgi:hypothetical protein
MRDHHVAWRTSRSSDALGIMVFMGSVCIRGDDCPRPYGLPCGAGGRLVLARLVADPAKRAGIPALSRLTATEECRAGR